ncbi:MAG: hypothetical protein F7B17_00775 [Desulfurococcales archaeon]|nr:hypothetical protein [Desulfurococcales archaeon]
MNSGEVRVKLLASLRESAGLDEIVVKASTWKEALALAVEKVPSLKTAINSDGSPKPGYIVFVDGVDSRLLEGGESAREIVVLPVNHGGGETSSKQRNLIYLSWNDIEEASSLIARRVLESGFKPNVIVGVLRGGIVPARLIADELGVEDIGMLEVKLYTGINLRKPKPYVRQPLIIDVYDKKVLIVDDVSDTGLTLSLALDFVRTYMPSTVKTATLFIKPWTRLIPDYYAKSVEGWIVFPWEKREIEREMAKATAAKGSQ